MTILLLLTSVVFLQGQTAEDKVIQLKGVGLQQAEEETVAEQKEADLDSENTPGSWNFSVGTSYSYMKGYGSGMMFYAAPTYTLPITNRWALHGGVIASQYYSTLSYQTGESALPGSFSSLAMFAAASYQMSDRLVLHGTGVKSLVSAPTTPFTPYSMDHLSFGATYKLGNNFSIGATIHMNNGNGSYSTPFGGHTFPSPFYW